jgi:hypothetical protein
VRTLGRVVLLVALGVLGAVAGVLGAFVHAMSVEIGGVEIPVGLPLALGAAGAVFVLAGWLLRNRLAVLAPAVGWLIPVLVMAAPRAEGDLVVAGNLSGYLFLLGGATLIGLAIALPYGNRGGLLRPVP